MGGFTSDFTYEKLNRLMNEKQSISMAISAKTSFLKLQRIQGYKNNLEEHTKIKRSLH